MCLFNIIVSFRQFTSRKDESLKKNFSLSLFQYYNFFIYFICIFKYKKDPLCILANKKKVSCRISPLFCVFMFFFVLTHHHF
jgi:hypothetical protein